MKTPNINRRRLVQTAAAGAAIGLMPAAAPRAAEGPALSAGWTFREVKTGREADTGEWLPATVPGTVHTDLLANGKIQDPFYRTNERDQQWIDKKDWEYATRFDLDAATLAHEHIELVFEGLDTYADVFVNDAPVLSADNMFRIWTANIKAHAKAGPNALRIRFRSPIQEGLKQLAALGYNPPATNDQSENGGLGDKKVSVFTRKAGYHYGWDWGPRFVTSGVWRPVRLRAWSGARISDLHIVQDSLSADEAKLTAVFEIVSDAGGPAVVDIHSDDAGIAAKQAVTLQPGVNLIELPVTIAKPKLWWSNGLGEAHLYKLAGHLSAGSAADGRELRIGLRTVRVVQKPDADGSSFYVELNGVPVFMKGASYIPNDSFLPRVTTAVYERVVKSAVDTHMNMIRVWGGGVYEDDRFYDLCDENGILVWQEFAFACSMYPNDPALLANIRAEAEDNVRRLRNHACITLWCGNNEIDVAWENDVPNGGWGWKQNYTQAQRDEMWAAYKAIFYDILPQTLAKLDPQRFYWPSSPLAAWDGHDEVRHSDLGTPKQSGDIHYWDVWWGQKPFSDYRTHIGRFMTEYGFQSFPEWRTVQAYAAPGDYDIFSDVMKAHQRSSIGNGTIKNYMQRDYIVPKDFRQFLYVGQVLQAEGIKVAMEAHRARRDYCMGSLFWQINDCWPVASWSSIDYYGRWKAQQFYARKSFAPVLVSAWLDGDKVSVHVVSDRLGDVPATLELLVRDFHGKVLKRIRQPLTLKGNAAAMAWNGGVGDLLAGAAAEHVFVHARLVAGKDTLAEDRLYLKPVKDLVLPSPQVDVMVRDLPGGAFGIALKTDVLVKNLYLSFDDSDAVFSDNYFDLVPGETVVIQVKPATTMTAEAVRHGLKLMHMAQITA